MQQQQQHDVTAAPVLVLHFCWPHRLLKLALPMVLQSLALMLLTFVSTTFVGHLNDPLALSAVVLSSSLYNVSGGPGWLSLNPALPSPCCWAGTRSGGRCGVVWTHTPSLPYSGHIRQWLAIGVHTRTFVPSPAASQPSSFMPMAHAVAATLYFAPCLSMQLYARG